MYRFLLLLCVFVLSFFTFSQTQGVAYTAVGKGVATTFLTDYQCLGVNTSALGWGTGYEKKKFTLGSSEFGFGIYSDVLTKEKLKNFYNAVNASIRKDTSASFDWNKQKQAVNDYALAGITMFADYNWGGFAYQGKIFGGIAFNVRENYQWYSKLNQTAADVVLNGKVSSLFDSLTLLMGVDTVRVSNTGTLSPDSLNAVISGSMAIPLNLSSLLRGTSIKMSWNRSYNLGYGRKVFGIPEFIDIYAGVGGRIIKSVAMFNLEAGDELMMYSSLSPVFKIDYQNLASGKNILSNYDGGIPPSVGSGYGVDLSASAILWDKFKFALAINNLGSVTYNRNVYKVKDTLIGNVRIDGLTDANLTKSINQLIQEGGLLSLQGTEKYKLTNASTIRIGGSFHFKNRLGVGFDMVAPFNSDNPGNIKNAIVSAGGDIRIVKWLQLSLGFYGGGIYKNNFPVGINFILRDGRYECGVSSRNIMSFFKEDTHSLSFAFGFARFRF